MLSEDKLVDIYYGIGNIFEKIKTGLRSAGKDIDSLTVDDLLPIDEFHTRGRKATREIAELSNIKASDLVLDVGCGLGGTARYLAQQYKCSVMGIDLTREYISVGTKLTVLVNLDDRVKLRHGSALDIPYEDERFDTVWTQHVQMNVADKKRFYSEIGRVLKPGGCFLFHDVFRKGEKSAFYPTPWAEDESMSVLATETEVQVILAEVGLAVDHWIGNLLGDNAKDKFRNYTRNLSENLMTVTVGTAYKE